tara:strand:+ start:105 stop:563 length:459 start_codon:yes stop_codon:yes gene_type:complete
MLIAINSNDIDINKVKILEKQKNNIINNGYFYKILYYEKEMTINGIYMYLTLKNVKIDNYFNKLKCIFNIKENETTIKILVTLENSILNMIKPKYNLVYSIKELIEEGTIKIFSNGYNNVDKNIENINLILKVSGIWSENERCGLTFRFMLV